MDLGSLTSNPIVLFFGPAMFGIGIAAARRAAQYEEFTPFDAVGAIGIAGGIIATVISLALIGDHAAFGEGPRDAGVYTLIALAVMAVAYGVTEFIAAEALRGVQIPYTRKRGTTQTASGIPAGNAPEEVILGYAQERVDDLDEILPDNRVWSGLGDRFREIVDETLPGLIETRDALYEDVRYANRCLTTAATAEGGAAEDGDIASRRDTLTEMLTRVEGRIAKFLTFLTHANLDVRIAVRRGESAATDIERRLESLDDEIRINAEAEEQVRAELREITGSGT